MTTDSRELKAWQLKVETEESVLEIARFVNAEEFQSLLGELWDTPPEERREFVQCVVLNEEELADRGINVPEDMVIQRSAFADQRPTLFCVSKKLSNEDTKVTVTFDNVDNSGA